MHTHSKHYLTAAALAVSAWVAFAGLYGCYLFPARPWPFAAALAVMATAWTARQFSPAARRPAITGAIVLAGLVLGAALLAPLGVATGLEGRGMGILFGLIVVVASNGIPKRASSARAMAVRRAAGWSMVLGGLGYALCWLLLPLEHAALGSLLCLLAAVLLATVRVLRARSGNTPA